MDGYSGSCVRASKGQLHSTACDDMISVSFEAVQVNMTTMSCKQPKVAQCIVTWSCAGCVLGFEQRTSRINVGVQSPDPNFIAAQEVQIDVRNDWLQAAQPPGASTVPKAEQGMSKLSMRINAGRPDQVLRGPRPSTVRTFLVPANYEDMVKKTDQHGYVLEPTETILGSVVDAAQFHDQRGELFFKLEFMHSNTYFHFIKQPKESLFDFLAQILAYMSGMSLLARVVTAVVADVSPETKSCLGGCIPWSCLKRCAAYLCCCHPAATVEVKLGDDVERANEQLIPLTSPRQGTQHDAETDWSTPSANGNGHHHP